MPDVDALGATALFAALGLLLVWLAQPLVRREVGPNGLHGLRVPSTLADPEVWYAANARCGRELRALGLLVVAGAVLLPWSHDVPTARLLVALFIAGLVVVAVRGRLFADRLFRERVEAAARGGEVMQPDAS